MLGKIAIATSDLPALLALENHAPFLDALDHFDFIVFHGCLLNHLLSGRCTAKMTIKSSFFLLPRKQFPSTDSSESRPLPSMDLYRELPRQEETNT
jgi:hypothetical protein